MESIRHQNNLRNILIICNHHGYGSKKRFEIIGEFLPASVGRICCDENPQFIIEDDPMFLEQELLEFRFQGVLDHLDLLSDHREHFDTDSVKLVETGPAAALGETGEKAPHCFIIQRIRTIKNQTLNLQTLANILNGLGFARSCRPIRISAHTQRKRACHGQIAPVRQIRNDQS
jgi:hypothetical protein